MSFTGKISKTYSSISSYLSFGFGLQTSGKQLQRYINRKNGSYKVMADVNLHFIDDEINHNKLGLKNNDIVIIGDYIIKTYNGKKRALEEIDEEALILTTSNDAFFYDQGDDRLVYLSHTRNNLQKYKMVDDYCLFDLFKNKKVDPSQKYKEKIYKKLEEENIDPNYIKQLEEDQAINYFSSYIATSSYFPAVFSILIKMFTFTFAMVAAAAAIGLLSTGALVFAVIVAIAAPISSGISAVTSVIYAIINRDSLSAYAALCFTSSAIGFTMLALAAIFPAAAFALIPLGTFFAGIGTIGTAIVYGIKYQDTIKKYYNIASEWAKNSLIPSIKKITPDQHLKNVAYLGLATIPVLAIATIVCAFVFPPAALVLLGSIATVTAISVGGFAIGKVVEHKDKIINFCKHQKNKVVDWAKKTPAAEHLRNTSYVGATVTTGLFVAAVVSAFVFPPAVPFLLATGTLSAFCSVGTFVASKAIKHKEKITGAFNKTKDFIKNIPNKFTDIVNNAKVRVAKWTIKSIFKKRNVVKCNDIKMQDLVLASDKVARRVKKINNTRKSISRQHSSKKQISSSTRTTSRMMEKFMFNGGRVTSVLSCPTLYLLYLQQHAHRSLHAAGMVLVTSLFFGMFAGARKFLHGTVKGNNKKASAKKVSQVESTEIEMHKTPTISAILAAEESSKKASDSKDQRSSTAKILSDSVINDENENLIVDYSVKLSM